MAIYRFSGDRFYNGSPYAFELHVFSVLQCPVLSVCDVGGRIVAKRLDGSNHQDATWHGGRPRLRPHC